MSSPHPSSSQEQMLISYIFPRENCTPAWVEIRWLWSTIASTVKTYSPSPSFGWENIILYFSVPSWFKLICDAFDKKMWTLPVCTAKKTVTGTLLPNVFFTKHDRGWDALRLQIWGDRQTYLQRLAQFSPLQFLGDLSFPQSLLHLLGSKSNIHFLFRTLGFNRTVHFSLFLQAPLLVYAIKHWSNALYIFII